MKNLYRGVIACLLAIGVSACGFNAGPLSTGFMDLASPSPEQLPEVRSTPIRIEEIAAPAPYPVERRKSLAHQTKPEEKALKGSPVGRDYSGIALNPERARLLINDYRLSKGLKPVALSVELTKAAKVHCRDLAKWDRISHFGSDGSNPSDRVQRTGYNARLTAENVGTGQLNFEEVLKGWKESPGHNKNLLMRDAEHMGIALVTDPKTGFKSFWTLVLGATM